MPSLTYQELETICKRICDLSHDVGVFIQRERTKIKADAIEEKGLNNFVTYVDKASEVKLMETLSEILPEAGFIAEENTSSKKGERYNWVIDPLDGTTNFIHGLPCYAISIALIEDNEPIIGVVFEINFSECFYAWKGGKAYLNNQEIHVSGARYLKDSLLATGFPYHDYGKLKEYIELFTFFIKQTHGIRRLGSAATDLAYVACGRFEGFYEYGLHPWDVAAGALILKQAGGQVCDFKGTNNYLFGKELIASNNYIFNEFKEAVKKHFT